jgi:hypothetical protein
MRAICNDTLHRPTFMMFPSTPTVHYERLQLPYTGSDANAQADGVALVICKFCPDRVQFPQIVPLPTRFGLLGFSE